MANNRENVFHGFSEEEISAAFENSSWRERNSLICSFAGSNQKPSLEFATLCNSSNSSSSNSSNIGSLAHSPKNSPTCGLELVCDAPPASSDCSMELGQVGSYLPPLPLQSPVATKRATVHCRCSLNPVCDKINSDPPSADQQEEFHGFSDLDVSVASEKADVLRKEGDLLKHDLAEARAAHKANHEEDVKQRAAAEGIQAVSVAKPELVSEDATGESEMRGTSEKPETVVIRKLPKSATSSES